MKTKRSPAKGPKARIIWLGHSAFHIESPGGKHILVDPWLDNPKAPPDAKVLPVVDLILITHGHGDHMGNVVELAKRTNAPVYAIYEVALYLQSAGLANAVGMNISGSATVAGITFTMVEARHSSMVEEGGHTGPGGTPAGFVIELENGLTLYHAGDTGVFSDMKLIAELYRPSVVMLPIGGLFTMGPREAAKACTLLDPKVIIGMHYGTFPVLTGTPAELKMHLPPRLKQRVQELEPGKPLVV